MNMHPGAGFVVVEHIDGRRFRYCTDARLLVMEPPWRWLIDAAEWVPTGDARLGVWMCHKQYWALPRLDDLTLRGDPASPPDGDARPSSK